MSDDLCYTPATALAVAIHAGDASPLEVTRAVLDRIDAHDGQINAFTTVTAEQALDTAKAAERALAKGENGGRLHGLPVTIKDLFDVEGLCTERGSLTHRGNIATADSPVTARLKAAGAIILGKTTTSEFGWTGVSRSPLTGVTHNPWRHGYNTGASSAGAGAAAAAGFGPLHQGLRRCRLHSHAAHFSGVFGLKPTWGVIPHVPVRNSDQVSHVGPITRTVADAALFLNATAGAPPFDHTSLTGPGVDYGNGLESDVAGCESRTAETSATPGSIPKWQKRSSERRPSSSPSAATSKRPRPVGRRRPGARPVLLGRSRSAACRLPG